MNRKNPFILLLISLLLLTACQPSNVISAPELTELPIETATFVPPTLTPTATMTPEPTHTPTITSTPTPAVMTIAAGAVEVPILMYHHVIEKSGYSLYNILPEVFDQQMAWLHENGYQTINVSDLARLIREGGEIPLKPVIITIDDGNQDIYDNAFPILEKYGFSATFYVVTTYVGGKDMVTAEQLIDLHNKGWEIGVHSYTHEDLTAADVDLNREIGFAKSEMERKLGFPVNTFAYPFGQINPRVVQKTYEAGFGSAVGLGSSIIHDKDTIYYLSRIEVSSQMSFDAFTAVFQR